MWKLYEQIEPFGERRADYRAGIVASTIANANRDPNRRPTPFKAEEFLVVTEDGKREMTDEEIAAGLAEALGAPK